MDTNLRLEKLERENRGMKTLGIFVNVPGLAHIPADSPKLGPVSIWRKSDFLMAPGETNQYGSPVCRSRRTSRDGAIYDVTQAELGFQQSQ
jgi:hypothetical protein